MVTVIIPAFNAQADLARAIASIRFQTFEDWQCIVVDDGSRQPLEPIVEAFRDPRIRVIRHRFNQGRGAARQTGLDEVTTSFVAWQDADDWSYPERLERQLQALKAEPRAHLVSTCAVVTSAGEHASGVAGRPHDGRKRLRNHEPISVVHASLLFRRSVTDRIHYNPRFRTSEDHDFMMRALRDFAFLTLADSLYVYREQQSRSFGKYIRSTLTRLEVAATLIQLRPVDRAVLVGSHVTKLGLHAGFGIMGHREWLATRSFVPIPSAVLAHHLACSALLDGELDRVQSALPTLPKAS